MRGRGIALDEAELLSVLMEGVLYGFSLLMFCGTIWALVSPQSTHRMNRRVMTVACLLLLFSTAHFVINTARVVEGFVLYRDTFPGGPIEYFSDVSQWTFVSMNYVFTAQTLLGDAVVLYRCYAVWQSKLIMVVPTLLWCALVVTGFECPYTESQVKQEEVFDGRLAQWITGFWASALATNLVATVLLTSRIWYVDRKVARMRGTGKSQLRPMLHIIIDAGLIYTLTLLVEMTCFLCRANFQYLLLPMVTPIISITFYMVIIRVELANRTKQAAATRLTSSEVDPNMDRRRTMQARTTTLTESKIENGHFSPIGLVESECHSGGDKPGDVGVTV